MLVMMLIHCTIWGSPPKNMYRVVDNDFSARKLLGLSDDHNITTTGAKSKLKLKNTQLFCSQPLPLLSVQYHRLHSFRVCFLSNSFFPVYSSNQAEHADYSAQLVPAPRERLHIYLLSNLSYTPARRVCLPSSTRPDTDQSVSSC